MSFFRRSNHKYGARKVTSQDGYSFSSKLERAVFEMLRLREMAGEIKILQVQAQVHLSRAKILYKPDFRCELVPTGEEFYVEAKGYETTDWRIKRRLWMSYGPAKLEIWKGNARGVFLHEEIVPKREGDEK